MSKTLSHIDILIRILHIIIMIAFTGAYFTGDNEDLHQVHMMFGYILLGLTSEASSPFIFYVVAPKTASLADASVNTFSTEAPSLADSVGLHTLKVAQNTTSETNTQQKNVPIDDLLKSSSASDSDPVAKLLASTALKPTQAPEQTDVNTSVDQTTNLDQILPNTTSSPLQNILEQTYLVV
ncbi:hypothetical protein Asch02_00882 [Acinetobacter schindleri]